MKKTLIVILIIMIVCAIGCVCIIGLSRKNSYNTSSEGTSESEAQAELTTYPEDNSTSQETTTEESQQRYDVLEGESLLGESIVASTTTEATGNICEITTEFPDCFDLELEIISQYPELPAGCESVSLTMILNYLGYDVTKTELVDNYLVYDGNFVMGYCGNPYSYEVGGGCYAPGMTITANNFLGAQGSKHTAYNITGTDFDELLEYVAQGYPILIWTTINMADSSKGSYNYDEEGNPYAWDYNEHCVVLTGYDFKANSVTVYDPIAGIVYREKDHFQTIYENMNEMAVVIKESE